MELAANQIHEEEAAIRIRQAIMGQNLTNSAPSEGRVNLKATSPGLLKINVPALDEINLLGDLIIATLHNNTVCKNRHDRCRDTHHFNYIQPKKNWRN